MSEDTRIRYEDPYYLHFLVDSFIISDGSNINSFNFINFIGKNGFNGNKIENCSFLIIY